MAMFFLPAGYPHWPGVACRPGMRRSGVRGRAVEIKDRKVTVEVTVTAADKLCARGRVIMVQIRDQH